MINFRTVIQKLLVKIRSFNRIVCVVFYFLFALLKLCKNYLFIYWLYFLCPLIF